MEITVRRLARPADQDFTDLTTAVKTGPAQWVGPDRLLIPFTPEPSTAEQEAITRRLVTEDVEDEDTARDVDQVLTQLVGLAQNTDPLSNAQLTAAVRFLAKVVWLLVRRDRRRRRAV